MRCLVQLGHVPIDEFDAGITWANCFRHAEIVAHRNTPWIVHHLCPACEESFRYIAGPFSQRLCQLLGFQRGHGHSLSIDRIEAADGVPNHQISARESLELFIAPPTTGCEPRGSSIA